MKITMYELLGMVKDSKSPKKIKYKDFIYESCITDLKHEFDFLQEEY